FLLKSSATSVIYTLSLHDALPIYTIGFPIFLVLLMWVVYWIEIKFNLNLNHFGIYPLKVSGLIGVVTGPFLHGSLKHLFNNSIPDRKSTRLNSSHVKISYAVFCLK